MPQVDSYVQDNVAAWLREKGKDLLAPVAADLAPLLAESERLRARLAGIDADYDAGHIDGPRYASAKARVGAELEQVQREMSAADTGSALGEILASDDPATAFLDAELMTRRSVVAAVCTVRLLRGTRGSRTFDPDTVVIDWH